MGRELHDGRSLAYAARANEHRDLVIIRGIQQLFSNKDNLAEYEQAVQEGRTVLAVKVDDGEARDRADEILERWRAHTVNHFGTAVVRTLKA